MKGGGAYEPFRAINKRQGGVTMMAESPLL